MSKVTPFYAEITLYRKMTCYLRFAEHREAGLKRSHYIAELVPSTPM